MKKPGTGSDDPYSLHYLRRRTRDLATAKTRAITDPLADWALRRMRLDGRPYTFQGHAYLRAIYDETARFWAKVMRNWRVSCRHRSGAPSS